MWCSRVDREFYEAEPPRPRVPHLSLAGPPEEQRFWRRFVGLTESGIEVVEALAVIAQEHGPQARRIVCDRLRSLVLAMGRDLEVGS